MSGVVDQIVDQTVGQINTRGAKAVNIWMTFKRINTLKSSAESRKKCILPDLAGHGHRITTGTVFSCSNDPLLTFLVSWVCEDDSMSNSTGISFWLISHLRHVFESKKLKIY